MCALKACCKLKLWSLASCYFPKQNNAVEPKKNLVDVSVRRSREKNLRRTFVQICFWDGNWDGTGGKVETAGKTFSSRLEVFKNFNDFIRRMHNKVYFTESFRQPFSGCENRRDEMVLPAVSTFPPVPSQFPSEKKYLNKSSSQKFLPASPHWNIDPNFFRGYAALFCLGKQ